MARIDHTRVARFKLGDDAQSSQYRQKQKIKRADQQLQAEIGEQLKDIARWCGERARCEDDVSLALLKDYLELVLGSLKPKSVGLVIEGEEVEG